jgi:hypothetical protein
MSDGMSSEQQPGDLAAAKLSEAFEYVDRARGHLYSFHQLTGHADLLLDEVIEQLEKAGRDDLIEEVRRRLFGLNVLTGRWTFEIVDDFDTGYYSAWKDVDTHFRDELSGGRRHVYEARMKTERQAQGVYRGREPGPAPDAPGPTEF